MASLADQILMESTIRFKYFQAIQSLTEDLEQGKKEAVSLLAFAMVYYFDSADYLHFKLIDLFQLIGFRATTNHQPPHQYEWNFGLSCHRHFLPLLLLRRGCASASSISSPGLTTLLLQLRC